VGIVKSGYDGHVGRIFYPCLLVGSCHHPYTSSVYGCFILCCVKQSYVKYDQGSCASLRCIFT